MKKNCANDEEHYFLRRIFLSPFQGSWVLGAVPGAPGAARPPLSTFCRASGAKPSVQRSYSHASRLNGAPINLVAFSWHADAAAANKEIQIGSAIGLHYMLVIQLVIAAVGWGRRLIPPRTSPFNFGFADIEVKTSCAYIEIDRVSILNKRECPSRRGFRRYMQNDGAIGRATHSRVVDAHHVRDASLQKFCRQR